MATNKIRLEVTRCIISREFRINGQIWVKVLQIFLLPINPLKLEWEKEEEILKVGLLVCKRSNLI